MEEETEKKKDLERGKVQNVTDRKEGRRGEWNWKERERELWHEEFISIRRSLETLRRISKDMVYVFYCLRINDN